MTPYDKIRAALEMARELIPEYCGIRTQYDDAFAALAELELAAKDPAATVCLITDRFAHNHCIEAQLQVAPDAQFPIGTKLYTAPPPAPVASLNDRQRLEAVIEVLDRYLPPDAPLTEHEAMNEIIGLVDPLPPAPVAAPKFEAAEVTQEMCARVAASFYGADTFANGVEMHEALQLWQRELGPTLGLAVMREPTPEECERISWQAHNTLDALAETQEVRVEAIGRAMFDAVREVMWPKGME